MTLQREITLLTCVPPNVKLTQAEWDMLFALAHKMPHEQAERFVAKTALVVAGDKALLPRLLEEQAAPWHKKLWRSTGRLIAFGAAGIGLVAGLAFLGVPIDAFGWRADDLPFDALLIAAGILATLKLKEHVEESK